MLYKRKFSTILAEAQYIINTFNGGITINDEQQIPIVLNTTVSWCEILQQMNISEELISLCDKNMCWICVADYLQLSDKFIEKYIDRIPLLSLTNQKLSPYIIKKYDIESKILILVNQYPPYIMDLRSHKMKFSYSLQIELLPFVCKYLHNKEQHKIITSKKIQKQLKKYNLIYRITAS